MLKPNAPFVFSLAHPFALCVDDGRVARPYLDTGPVMVQRWDEAITAYPRSLSETFADLSRAGFRVDTLLELSTTSADAPVRRPSCGAPARKAHESGRAGVTARSVF